MDRGGGASRICVLRRKKLEKKCIREAWDAKNALRFYFFVKIIGKLWRISFLRFTNEKKSSILYSIRYARNVVIGTSQLIFALILEG